MMALPAEDVKSHLAAEICDISARAIACAKKKSPFIDWYLVLRVDENADIDGIRKQYHKLALQLHPDKNKHPKAEAAFKLVSEAYLCLSDTLRRDTFDSEREKLSNTPKPKPHHQLRARLSEEVGIIQKCLLANARRNGTITKSELPVFDPSHYYQHPPPQRRMESFRKCDKEMSGSPVYEYQSERRCATRTRDH